MNDITLKTGGRLIAAHWNYDETTGTGTTEHIDVSHAAVGYLFDLVEVEDGVTLADVFLLLRADAALQQVYARSYAESLCAEAARGPLPWPDANPDHALEYLELFRTLEFDSAERTYGRLDQWSLHGVGVVLDHDYPSVGCSAGERIEWSIHMTPLRQMLALPLRIKTEASVFELDRNAKRRRKGNGLVKAPHITLGQLLHRVLHELSWYGTPEELAQVSSELGEHLASSAKRAAGEAVADVGISNDDPFEEMNRPGVTAMFESVGAHSCCAVAYALRKLDDEVNAAQALGAELGADVVVKAEHQKLSAYEFRKAFRQAKLDAAQEHRQG